MEELIARASEYKEALQELTECYERLPSALAEERRAIEERSIPRFERQLETKQMFSEKLEELRSTIATKVEALNASLDSDLSGTSSATEVHVALKSWVESGRSSGLGGQVFKHLTAQIGSLTDRLLQTRSDVLPSIQINRTIIQELLSSYQQSGRFWQEIVNEVEATYRPDGTTRAEGATSVLKVQA